MLISFDRPASSHIARVGYETETGLLMIEFQDGSQYEYVSVPREVYDAFQGAGSAGSFFARHIKGRYAYREG